MQKKNNILPKDDICQQLAIMTKEIAELDFIPESTTPFSKLNFDQFDQIELVIQAEEFWQIILPDLFDRKLKSIEEIAQVVAANL